MKRQKKSISFLILSVLLVLAGCAAGKKTNVTGSGGARGGILPPCGALPWMYCHGFVKYRDGARYVGEYNNNQRNGKGTFTFPNDDKYVKYVGEFKNNQMHGKGILTHADGRVEDGVWENGNFMTSTATSEKPKQIVEKTEPKAIPNPTPPPSSTSTSGSGFFVSKLGHIITNQHVVNECGRITVGDNARQQVQANLIEADKRNDLALLKLSSIEMASTETKSLIRKLGVKVARRGVPLSSDGLLRSDDVELGERVMVSGYPYGEIFSDTIKVTGGMVSAIRGMGDDSGQFQLDAAVQPGNSGGPIYDGYGNIVGIVVAQLNKLKVARAIGSLPENVNFGIKASTVRQFLSSAGLPTKWSNNSTPLATKDLAEIAKNQTLMVVCH